MLWASEMNLVDIDGRILYSFLWADPADDESDLANARSKIAGMFVESETREFCQHNEVSFIVRSHQVPSTLRGVMACQNGLCSQGLTDDSEPRQFYSDNK